MASIWNARVLVVAMIVASVVVGCGGSGGGTFKASTGSMDDGLTAGTIYGRASDSSNGAGMGDVQLQVARAGGTSGSVATKTASASTANSEVSLDADGNYVTPALLAGTYTLSANRVGYNPFTSEVSVNGGDRVLFNFTLTASNGSTGIRGVLLDETRQPVAGATITLKPSGSQVGARKVASAQGPVTISTNSDGWYAAPALSEGVYAVKIEHPSHARRLLSLTVKAGQLQQLNLVMKAGNPAGQADVFGFVRDSRGQPIGGANVSLDYQILRGKQKSAAAGPVILDSGLVTTDSTGFYAFLDVSQGQYVVKAEHPQFLANAANVTAQTGVEVEQDLVLHWRLVFNGAADYFLGLWGTTPSNVFAVGALGVIKHCDRYDSDGRPVWTYLNSPTGENLFGVWGTSDGTLVLAVGNGSTVTRSSDGGATWAVVGAGVGASCHAVWGTSDGKAIYAISPLGDVFKSTDRGLTWIPGHYTTVLQPSPKDTNDLNHISGLPDGSAVFIAGRGGIVYRSTDGGSSWAPVDTGLKDDLRYVHCWSDSTVVHVVASGAHLPSVVRSDDGGNSWSVVALPKISPALPFEQRGMCGLADGSALYLATTQYVVRSADGGKSWSKVGDGDTLDFCVWAGVDPDPSKGESLFMGAAEGRIWVATRAGSAWDDGSNQKASTVWDLLSVYAFSNSEICATGRFNPSSQYNDNTGLGFYTAGLHGTSPSFTHSLVNVGANALRSIWGSPDRLYAAAADQGVCVTEDRGATWRQQFTFPQYYVNGFSGGASWGRLVAVGYDWDKQASGVLAFIDDTNHWHSVFTNPGEDMRSVTRVGATDRYVVVGGTATSGLIWIFDPPSGDLTAYKPVLANTQTSVPSMLNAVWSDPAGAVLYAVGNSGVLLTSTDGGYNWTQSSLGTRDLYGVWGSSVTDVIVVGYENYRYDGKKWLKMTAQNEGTVITDKFYSIGVSGSPDATHVYAVGLGGRVYVVDR